VSRSGWQIFVEVPGKPPIELQEGESVVGRSRNCAVQIAESTVSRQHAILQVQEGTVRLKDLGSSNGTFLNGQRVAGEAAVADGDRMVIGEAEIVIHVLPPLGPNDATVKVTLPPLTDEPLEPAPPPLAPPAPAPAVPSTPPAVRALAQPAVEPSRPAVVPPPPLPAAPRAAAEPDAAKGGELLSSIQEIERTPVPPPAPRRAAVTTTIEPAGFWIRVAATLLDSLFMGVLFGVVFAVGLAAAFVLPPELALTLSTLLSLAGGFGTFFLLYLYLPATRGWTPGKKVLGLRIYADPARFGQGLGWSKTLMRLVGHVVCSLTFCLGYLLVAFTSRKQGLHDLIAGTFVGRRR